MNHLSICASCIAALAALLSGCDGTELRAAARPGVSYSGCLASAVAGPSTRSLQEIREACAEAANVVDAHYKMVDNAMVPSNDFTRCYDAEKKRFDNLGPKDAIRFAKLSCKYPDVK